MNRRAVVGLFSLGVVLVVGASVLVAQGREDEEKPAAPKREKAAEKVPVTPKDNSAIVRVIVPANATIWFGDQKMSQTGIERNYQSPPLDQGKRYVYKLKVSWPTQGGGDFKSDREVEVQAGQTTIIDFGDLAPPGSTVRRAAPTPTYIQPAPPRRFFRRSEGSGYR